MFSIVGNSICVKIFRNVSDEEVGWESRIVPIPQKKWSKEKQRFFFALLMPHICRYSRAPLWDMQSNSANLLWESLWMFLGGLRIGWDYYSSLQISWKCFLGLIFYFPIWMYDFIAHLFISPPSSPSTYKNFNW